MDILSTLISPFSFVATYFLPFIFVLIIVVFVHELGHFLVARWCDVEIESFSIGFGSEIVGWTDRHGTRWKIAWIPLGGYVKFLGDDNVASAGVSQAELSRLPAETRARTFQAKSVWQRSLIAAAGPLANFLLSIVIFATLFATIGRTTSEARIDAIVAGSPAEAAGFRIGDVVISVDGRDVSTFGEMQRLIATSNGRELEIVVRRGGLPQSLRAAAREQENVDRSGRKHRSFVLGLRTQPAAESIQVERSDPLTALWLGARETWFVIDRTFSYIGDLFAGYASTQDLGGPIRIAEASGEAATVSFAALISLTAVLSVSIGLLNLFPIPMLDGGHLVFYGIEAILGRPLSERAQEIGLRIGFALVLMLMVMATWNDLARLWSS